MFRRKIPVNPLFLGVTLVTLFTAALVAAFVSSRAVPFRSYRYATAVFDDVRTLEKGDDVRVAGVRVGQVDTISFAGNGGRVRLQLPAGTKVYGDATAEIKSRSALGQKFVQLHPGTPSAGESADAVIPLTRTTSAVELDQVLDTLDPTTRKALASTLRELGTGVGGRGQDLNDLLKSSPSLLHDLGVSATTLAAPDTGLVHLLASADRLAGDLNGHEAQLSTLADKLGVALDAVGTDGGKPLQTAIAGLPRTLDAARPALDQLRAVAADAREALTQLRSGAAALGGATGDLRTLLRDAPTPLGRVPDVAQAASPAIKDLTTLSTDARPLSVKARRALGLARPTVEYASPYMPEIDGFLIRWGEASAIGDANGTWWRFTFTYNPLTLSDKLAVQGQLANPLGCVDPYPAPGQARNEYSSALGGCKK